MNKRPEKLYGLVGYPLGHSFSENFFNQKFEAESINAQYVNFEIPSIEDITQVINENQNLNGLNVTIPYKEQVIPFLDEIDENATNIGAVNVIKFTKATPHTTSHPCTNPWHRRRCEGCCLRVKKPWD